MIQEHRKRELTNLVKTLGINIHNLDLLNIALTHSSFTKEKVNKSIQNNERLEFFGDAILKLLISECLMNKYLTYSEGELSNLRAFVVSEKILSKIASKLNLKKYLLLGKNEKKSTPISILADSVEAILAVIYLDAGVGKAKEFVLNNWMDCIEYASEDKEKENYKAVLQEYTQSKKLGLPIYETISETGPDHNKIFKVRVSLNNNELASGKGKTKKDASQDAARHALIFLKKL